MGFVASTTTARVTSSALANKKTRFFPLNNTHFFQIRPASTPCVCAFPSECDSQGGGAPPTRAALKAAAAATAWDAAAGERAAAAASAVAEAAAAAGAAGAAVLERSLVSDVYDRIAPHFDSTRFAVWPQVAAFLKKCVEGGDGEEEEEEGRKKDASNPTTTAPKTKTNRPHLLLDVGCGNGKYLHLAPPGTAFLACEPCEGLAGAAADAARGSGKGFGAAPASKAQAQAVCVARADGIAMPYRSGVFDGVICIAVRMEFSPFFEREEREESQRAIFSRFHLFSLSPPPPPQKKKKKTKLKLGHPPLRHRQAPPRLARLYRIATGPGRARPRHGLGDPCVSARGQREKGGVEVGPSRIVAGGDQAPLRGLFGALARAPRVAEGEGEEGEGGKRRGRRRRARRSRRGRNSLDPPFLFFFRAKASAATAETEKRSAQNHPAGATCGVEVLSLLRARRAGERRGGRGGRGERGAAGRG